MVSKRSAFVEDLRVVNEEAKISESDLDHPDQPVFQDVGLIGNTEMILEKGYCIFSGIKFKNTSFNHDGSQFFLAVSIIKPESSYEHSKLN